MASYKMGKTGKVSYGPIVYAQTQSDRTLAYDYSNQAWLVDGVYVSCGHPDTKTGSPKTRPRDAKRLWPRCTKRQWLGPPQIQRNSFGALGAPKKWLSLSMGR